MGNTLTKVRRTDSWDACKCTTAGTVSNAVNVMQQHGKTGQAANTRMVQEQEATSKKGQLQRFKSRDSGMVASGIIAVSQLIYRGAR